MAEWPPCGRDPLIRFTVWSLCILTFVTLIISHIGFDVETVIQLIASVPGHCYSFTFYQIQVKRHRNSDTKTGNREP